MLLVADAQLPDPRVLVHSESPLGMEYVAELSREIYVRRAWRATRQLRPHVVMFLGDMLKSGRSVRSDEECAAPTPLPHGAHSHGHALFLADSQHTSSISQTFLCARSSQA